MDIIATKVLVAFLFGLLRLFFGLLPVKCYALVKFWENEVDNENFINEKRHKKVNCYLALFQSFGGGVLFATCLLHMMPEVNDSVEELKKYTNYDSDYPYSQLIVCFGFFFVYFIEEISHWMLSKVPNEEFRKTPRPNVITKLLLPKRNTVTPKSKTIENGKAFIIDDYAPENNEKNEDNLSVQKFIKDDSLSLNFAHDCSEANDSDLSVKQFVSDDSLSVCSQVQKENEKNLEKSSEIEATIELEKTIENETITQQQIFRCVLIILALSLHAVFEGLAIGLQTSTANIWYLFTAISIHSAIILFCVGLELLVAKTKTKSIVVHILILSVTSPFGVLLGLLITLHANMNTKAKSTAVVLLEGLSAGTILYITFFEVLNREKERRVYRVRRAICILAGFALMAILEHGEIYH